MADDFDVTDEFEPDTACLIGIEQILLESLKKTPLNVLKQRTPVKFVAEVPFCGYKYINVN